MPVQSISPADGICIAIEILLVFKMLSVRCFERYHNVDNNLA